MLLVYFCLIQFPRGSKTGVELVFLILQTLVSLCLSPLSCSKPMVSWTLKCSDLTGFLRSETRSQMFTHTTTHMPRTRSKVWLPNRNERCFPVIIWFAIPGAKQKWGWTLGRTKTLLYFHTVATYTRCGLPHRCHTVYPQGTVSGGCFRVCWLERQCLPGLLT